MLNPPLEEKTILAEVWKPKFVYMGIAGREHGAELGRERPVRKLFQNSKCEMMCPLLDSGKNWT
jgi:hypothetical protein